MIQTIFWCVNYKLQISKLFPNMVLFLTKYHFGQLALNFAGLLFAFPLYPDFLPNPPENQKWVNSKI